jgi:hypothetical protein
MYYVAFAVIVTSAQKHHLNITITFANISRIITLLIDQNIVIITLHTEENVLKISQ